MLLTKACAAPSLAYTLLGDSYKHQHYVWHSIYQARIFNPLLPIHIIFNDAELAASPATKERQEQLGFDTFVYNPRELGGVHTEFKQRFFIQGKMTPDGNTDFNLYTTQRLFALHWYMVTHNVTDLWHTENDNLIYTNLANLVPAMHACKVGLGVPFTETSEGVASLIFLDNAEALHRFLLFVVEVFKMPKLVASKYVNNEYVNDMSLLGKYYDLHEQVSGAVKLPSTTAYRAGENCLWDRYKLLFDAEVVGQWYGGTWAKPGEQLWWPSRIFDPRSLKWIWKDSPNGHRVPYLGPHRLLNMHCHSKRLMFFMSPVNISHPSTKPR